MSPLELAKSVYGVVGAKHPTASLVGAMLVGALFAGVIWLAAAAQYQKDTAKDRSSQQPQAPPGGSGPVTTSGDQIPANAGNGVPASKPASTSPPPPSIQIGTIEQHADGGAAVAGVQGTVTVNAPAAKEEAKPKR